MKALIFAAGLGTRLKPLTDSIPKALVPVGGVPMLERVILKFKEAGFTEMVVNTCYFADKVEKFLAEKGNFGLDIRISREPGPELRLRAATTAVWRNANWSKAAAKRWSASWKSPQRLESRLNRAMS